MTIRVAAELVRTLGLIALVGQADIWIDHEGVTHSLTTQGIGIRSQHTRTLSGLPMPYLRPEPCTEPGEIP